jgi:hypothetical protein
MVGCGTTRVTNTQRTATEQLLISNAIDQSVSQLDFRILANKPVYFDAQYLGTNPDQGYVVSSLRQQLLASGCILVENRNQATYVVEARSGGIGTDQYQVLFGVPQMNLPSVLPGQPSLIPEIPFAKKTDQKGIAKILVFAYNRQTGRPVWQSGIVRSDSTSKDTWVLGAGPFRRGTLGEATEIAGQQLTIPLLSGKENGKEEEAPVIAVTRPAVWQEAPEVALSPYRLTSASTFAETAKAPLAAPPAPAIPPSVETVATGDPTALTQLLGVLPTGTGTEAGHLSPGMGPGQRQNKDQGSRQTPSSSTVTGQPK